MRILLAVLVLSLSACKHDPEPIGDTLTPIAVSLGDAYDAQRSAVGADIQTIGETNSNAPASPQKDAINILVDVASADNGNAQPDPQTLARNSEIARLALEGKLEESRRMADKALSESSHRQAMIDSLESKLKEETVKAEQAGRDAQAREQALKKTIEDNETSWSTRILATIGGVLILAGVAIGVLAFYTGGLNPKLIGASAICGMSGAGCFAFLNFLHHSWIPYAVGGLLLLAGVVTCVLLYLDQRHKAEKTTVLTETAAHIVDQIELASKSAPEAIAGLKSALGNAMDQVHKDVVKELESERPST